MPTNPLFHPVTDTAKTASLHDQIQVALAIADSTVLRSLLANAIPVVAPTQQIRSIAAQVGVPTGNQQTADGVVAFEATRCRLADPVQAAADLPPINGSRTQSRELLRLTQHESEVQTIGQNLPLATTVSLLAEAGFSSEQINEILHLPYNAWHKAWWYQLDTYGMFTLPFLRQMRTMRYPDGTFTIQYKDFFEQDNPECFTGLLQKVLVMIKPDTQSFSETLRQINYQRDALGIVLVILICNTISELEAQGLINQGVSVYPAIELILPTQSDCIHCGRKECAMNGADDSPVALCYGFLPESEFV